MVTNKVSMVHFWGVLDYFLRITGGVWFESDYRLLRAEVRK